MSPHLCWDNISPWCLISSVMLHLRNCGVSSLLDQRCFFLCRHKTEKPNASSVTQMLSQGLHSDDDRLIDTVLFKANKESIINHTIRRLPTNYILTLINKVCTRRFSVYYRRDSIRPPASNQPPSFESAPPRVSSHP